MSKSRWYSQLYVQVLIGIVIGAAIGHFEPQFGAKLQPFADGFIKLIKMLLAPIIFGTVVVGIAKMGSIKEVGRIGVKALLYFEILFNHCAGHRSYCGQCRKARRRDEYQRYHA